jgi:putative drug exporter of the RND superfamily
VDRIGTLARLPGHRFGKWIVLVLWLAVLAVFGPLAGQLSSVENNEQASWLPSDAESVEVIALAQPFQARGEVPTIVVYEKAGGFDQADLAVIADHAQRFAALDLVESDVVGPVLSREPTPEAARVIVPVKAGDDIMEKLPGVVDQLRGIAGDSAGGMAVHVTGPGGMAADQANAFAGIDGTLLFAALAVVIVMLLLTYRSPVLWLLPVIAAGAALGTSRGIVYLIARDSDLTVNTQSAAIMMVLVFGAGTDYALLLVARYREELRRHADRHEAMAIARHRAGPAILASAATVAAGLLCLLFANLNSTAALGSVAAIGIGIAVLSMLTLLPALLVIFGRWVFWPVRPAFGSADQAVTSRWARLGRAIAGRPRLTWVATALVLGVVALGTLGLPANGLTNAGTFTGTPDSVVGQQVLAQHFPAGAGQPIQVVARADRAEEVRATFAGVDGIGSVTPPVVRGELAYLEGVTEVGPDSQEARATVLRVRDALRGVDGAAAKVGGVTAMRVDTVAGDVRDRTLIIPIVLAVVFLILMGLLRSVLAPLVLIATVVLSFFAALGISAFFFDRVFGLDGTTSAFPLFVFVFLVALGVDYNIFLMSRVHEEAKQWGTRRGMLTGLSATGGVITSAGLVLAGTFAVLTTIPLVFIAELGFAVAVGVLIDTFLVRAVLVTALTLDIGRWMWWPSKLMHKRDVPAEVEVASQPEPVDRVWQGSTVP